MVLGLFLENGYPKSYFGVFVALRRQHPDGVRGEMTDGQCRSILELFVGRACSTKPQQSLDPALLSDPNVILEIVGQFQEGKTRVVARLGLNGHHAHERAKGAELDEHHLRDR